MKKKRGKGKRVKRARVKTIKKPRKKITTIKKVHETFSNYEERVDKLRALERELKVLKPKGFAKEVQIIKANLKDPSAVEEVERRINSLERKMLKRKKKKSPITKIQRKISELKKEDLPAIEKRVKKNIEELKKEEFPKIQSQIRNLKKTIDKRDEIGRAHV